MEILFFLYKTVTILDIVLPQNLEVLNLGDCLLKTEGARFIAYAIKNSHPNLREWNMESNEIRLVN